MKRLFALVGAATLLAGGCTKASEPPIRIGAVYPLSGSQGPGGRDEYRGVNLATAFVNQAGGVDGRPVDLVPLDVPSGDAAPGAVQTLAAKDVRFVLGSYGSTISEPAATAATRRGMLFWETGAVGGMVGWSESGGGYAEASEPMAPTEASTHGLFFRVAPTGSVLGRSAIDFIADELAPRLHRSPSSLRFAVAYVDDVYGSAVADGALAELRKRGLELAGAFGYDPVSPDMPNLVHKIAASNANVLFVAAYLQDGVALRREIVRQHVPLLANIGTSSSYCMPQFGRRLGPDALGLFASDKPDADSIGTQGLTPGAVSLLERARAAYRERYGSEMSAPALAGFSAAWALLHDVLPRANAITPSAVASAAVSTRLAEGSLPNGSGLDFAPASAPDAGTNLRAATVIWEWVGVDDRAVVWPPRFATTSIRPIPIAS
jgi:branched-chain amino acid transport system substrate-binding protein